MDYINEIREMMEGAGLTGLTFVYHYNKPTIQKDGIKYEILGIYAPEEGEATIDLDAKPNYEWVLKNLTMDRTWRASSWRHIRDVVKNELKRLEDIL